ncbi:hypothetical protein DAPPUDRAFT_324693 [Daphnia pulex]|uniref:Uncharacterized protein n=1 Tax=Daphnia pulex TaxID=6669 RepID=E9H2G6_DAPPU|nr:hypothetical protein DAPPUDRAFT_324693 [Daphnia pulex]|eukprot:EFX74073.1 hypothetical protein DAPPUDRAFT_324693 [Daphnia pulex]
MAMDVLDNNFILGCKAFFELETFQGEIQFHHFKNLDNAEEKYRSGIFPKL